MGSQLFKGIGSASPPSPPPRRRLQSSLVWKMGAEQTPPASVLRQLESVRRRKQTRREGWTHRGERGRQNLGLRELAAPRGRHAPEKGGEGREA